MTDTLFFIAAKLLGALLRVETWIVLLLAAIVLALWLRRHRTATRLATLTFAGLLALSILPLGDLALAPLERRYPVPDRIDRIDGIVVLGGAEDLAASRAWGRPQLDQAAERHIAARALAERHPEARVVFAGGSGALRDLAGPAISEADIARDILISTGLAPERLAVEASSRNTAENARRSRALAGPRPGERWVLVTSAFHMPRALRSFEAAGWPDLVPYPVDHRSRDPATQIGWNLLRTMGLLDIALKERVGLAVYALTGR